MARRFPPRRIKRPEHLSRPLIRLPAQFRIEVRIRITHLALGAMFKKPHRVIERDANLGEDLQLVFIEPEMVDIVGTKRRGDGESPERIAVPSAEPDFGRAYQVVHIAAEELAISSVLN